MTPSTRKTSFMGSAFHVDDCAPAKLAAQDSRRRTLDFAQRHLGGDPIEEVEVEVAFESSPTRRAGPRAVGVTELMPSRLTARRTNGIRVPASSALSTRPQDATAPPYRVCASTFASVRPPTLSTAARPPRGLQGPTLALKLATVDDLARAEFGQVCGCVRGRRSRRPPRRPDRASKRDGDRSDSPGRPGDQHLPVRDAVALEREHGLGRGEARGADGGRAAGAEGLGNPHERISRHPHPFRVTAVTGFAETDAVEHDGVTGRPVRILGGEDGSNWFFFFFRVFFFFFFFFLGSVSCNSRTGLADQVGGGAVRRHGREDRPLRGEVLEHLPGEDTATAAVGLGDQQQQRIRVPLQGERRVARRVLVQLEPVSEVECLGPLRGRWPGSRRGSGRRRRRRCRGAPAGTGADRGGRRSSRRA